MRKRLQVVGLTTVAFLAFSGSAHAAGYNGGQVQKVLDRALQAAPAGFTVNSSSRPPAKFDAAGSPTAQAAGGKYGYVGNGTSFLNNNQGEFYDVFVTQSKTPALAATALRDLEATVTSGDYAKTHPPSGFKSEKVKGHNVTFYEQPQDGTLNGAPVKRTAANVGLVDGRNYVVFSVINDDAATAQTELRTWLDQYLA